MESRPEGLKLTQLHFNRAIRSSSTDKPLFTGGSDLEIHAQSISLLAAALSAVYAGRPVVDKKDRCLSLSLTRRRSPRGTESTITPG